MRRLRLRSATHLASAAAALCVTAAPCSADTVNVFSDFFVIEAGAGTTLFEQSFLYLVPQFDPSLGTLDGMALTAVRGGVIATVSVDNEAPFAAAVLDGLKAVANTTVSYSGGQLAGISGEVVGPSPGFVLPPDSDGAPDFVGTDAFDFSGLIPASTINQTISDPSTLVDFTGLGLVLLTLTISELAGDTIPGIQALQAAYGEGIGVIALAYEYTAAPTGAAEPGAFALLALSGAVGLRRYRRSHSLRRSATGSAAPFTERSMRR